MPKKHLKLQSGTRVEVYAVRLKNGSVLVPARMPHDRTLVYWKVADKADRKRWQYVTIDGDDPRKEAEYKAHLQAIHDTPEYQQWQQQKK